MDRLEDLGFTPAQHPDCKSGMAFRDVAVCSVVAWLRRNVYEIARNGVLGRSDFFVLGLAKAKRLCDRQEWRSGTLRFFRS